jgi:leucyl-tRNA synthetase
MTNKKTFYDHKTIEKKWQKYWQENNIFKVDIDKKKPKYYVLDMFPYPSGAGLHVGHVTGYTGTDIMSRYLRQNGYNVLHPMGWDSFGLPAEQYAIRTGTHPSITTKKNIATYKKQLQSLGFSYDWSREIMTSDPKYYKWTQWIFTILCEKGLAYEAKMNVNYCPELKTVLANEEVENGRSKEGGYAVIRTPVKQWILKITAYADRLLEDLKELDWPDHLKKLQTNWIGRSKGAKIEFKETSTNKPITVFTTRPDTICGATYLVLAPEHPLVEEITTHEKKKEVEEYIRNSSLKSDLERTDLAKTKTGVFTGSYANHPVTNEKIPIWISDYVLISYGTGSIMAVPAHDERDFEFAQKFSLPIISVFDPDVSEIKEEFILDKTNPAIIRKEILNGKRCWPKDGIAINSSYGDFKIDGENIKEAIDKTIIWLEENNCGQLFINYKLRDWLFSRQRYWGEPIPILHLEDGTKRFLDIDELPLVPPELDDYHPAGAGESPLSKKEEWVNIKDNKTGKTAKRETNTMPQWAGSCWYYLRYLDPHNDKQAWSEDAEKYWMNIDLYVGGTEHAVLHLLYARFWHKVLYDAGYVTTKEPFKKYRNQGIVTSPSYKLKTGGYVHPDDIVKSDNGKYYSSLTNEEVTCQIEKMSKSKLNGVSPNEIIDEFGADALRLYEMFMGPFDKEKIWNTDAVSGCKRFLNRFYDMCYDDDKIVDDSNIEAKRLGHRLVAYVQSDIKDMQFNTAIAHMMEFINSFIKLKKYPREVLKMATLVLYPFAPHIAEEIWHHLGSNKTITFEPFPIVDKKYLVDDSVTIVVQINGKVRGSATFDKGVKKEEVMAFATSNERVAKYLELGIIKTIFIPDKILNIVVKQSK